MQRTITLHGVTHMHHYAAVRELFKVDLTAFWPDNVKGLDDKKFIAEVVRPLPKELPLAAVERRFGKAGLVLYKQLRPTVFKIRKLKGKQHD